jgi:hypothetical protein
VQANTPAKEPRQRSSGNGIIWRCKKFTGWPTLHGDERKRGEEKRNDISSTFMINTGKEMKEKKD